MGIHSYFFMSRTVLKKAIEVEQQNLSSQSSHVRSILVETQNTLIYISNLQSMLVLQSSDPTTDIYEASLQVLTYDLQNYIRMYPIVQHLAYYSTTGDPLIAVQSIDTRVPTEKFEEFVAQVLSSPDDTTHIFLDNGEDDNVSELTLALHTHDSVIVITVSSEMLFHPGINNTISETWSLHLPTQTLLHAIGEPQSYLSPEITSTDVWRRNSHGYYQHDNNYTFFEQIGIPTSRGQYNVVLFHTIPAQRLQPDLNQYAQVFVTLTIGVLLCVFALGLFAINNFIEPIAHLKGLVDEIRKTEKTPMLPKRLPPDEIGQLSLAFYTMAIELEAKRKSERALVEKLITAQEDERTRIAYDLHDGLLQQLVGARFYINQAKTLVTPAAVETLTIGCDTLSAAIVEGRRIMQGLHPSVLDDLGISEALTELSQTSGKVCGLQVGMDIQPLKVELDRLISVTLYRIAQEALNNVFKHAQADAVSVKLWQDDVIHLLITDDGRGFDAKQTSDGWGLRTMRERVNFLNGTYDLKTGKDNGTQIYVTLPSQSIAKKETTDDRIS
jgi:signal transduction histidine kinase